MKQKRPKRRALWLPTKTKSFVLCAVGNKKLGPCVEHVLALGFQQYESRVEMKLQPRRLPERRAFQVRQILRRPICRGQVITWPTTRVSHL
jgi:hypothetical protein